MFLQLFWAAFLRAAPVPASDYYDRPNTMLNVAIAPNETPETDLTYQVAEFRNGDGSSTLEFARFADGQVYLLDQVRLPDIENTWLEDRVCSVDGERDKELFALFPKSRLTEDILTDPIIAVRASRKLERFEAIESGVTCPNRSELDHGQGHE